MRLVTSYKNYYNLFKSLYCESFIKNNICDYILNSRKIDISSIYGSNLFLKKNKIKSLISIPLYDINSNVNLVITSCNRVDLLTKTLKSFSEFNTYPIQKIILIEDSGIVSKKYIYNQLTPLISIDNIDVIVNEFNIGQMRSVDRGYGKISSEYIFHCEDDWHFYNYSFIEKSKKLFDMYEKPEKENLLQVWIRNHNEMVTFAPFTKYGSLLEDNSIKYFYVFSSNHHWKGFSMNPGLKKLEDYQNIGSYEKLVTDFQYICKYCVFESLIGLYYFNHGFITLSLEENGYVEHLGWERSIKFGKGNDNIFSSDSNIVTNFVHFADNYLHVTESCITE